MHSGNVQFDFCQSLCDIFPKPFRINPVCLHNSSLNRDSNFWRCFGHLAHSTPGKKKCTLLYSNKVRKSAVFFFFPSFCPLWHAVISNAWIHKAWQLQRPDSGTDRPVWSNCRLQTALRGRLGPKNINNQQNFPYIIIPLKSWIIWWEKTQDCFCIYSTTWLWLLNLWLCKINDNVNE